MVIGPRVRVGRASPGSIGGRLCGRHGERTGKGRAGIRESLFSFTTEIGAFVPQ